jgi:hypothetical protein
VLADGAGLATTSTGAPLRMAFVYFPNGAHQMNWVADGAEAESNSPKHRRSLRSRPVRSAA